MHSQDPEFAQAVAQRWTAERANQWYAGQPWLVGANYNPSDAVNQLEMWQADTFNPDLIDRELALAESIGMNSMRVFLHDLLWEDANGFLDRIDRYLDLSATRGISTMLVLFDSVWRPYSTLGVQPAPTPGVHNSQWVQSPTLSALLNPAEEPRLRGYLEGVVGKFANDERVVVWDVWNEPGNSNVGRFGEPSTKQDRVAGLLPKVFNWVRSVNPNQPLTAGVWEYKDGAHTALGEIQLAISDVISFHVYDGATGLADKIDILPKGRPVLLTEYMARSQGGTFQANLPIAKREKIGTYCWGFVAGKTQTNLPWDSWIKPYVDGPPPLWFHDVFHADGTPYDQREIETILELTGAATRDDEATRIGINP